MVSDSLIEFVEQRYPDFEEADLDDLEAFLDKEKYLSDVAREKLFEHFEAKVKVKPEKELEPERPVITMMSYRTTWKYRYEKYLSSKGTEWVMKRDRKTGRFVKSV